jgi:nucleoside-diphosphate-sugar epimerase
LFDVLLCRQHRVPKLIMSSSPSTRFDGKDIDGLSEDELKFPKVYLQLYAESKAMAEKVKLSS